MRNIILKNLLFVFISVFLLMASRQQATIRIYTAGDSTMAEYDTNTDLRRGWVQNLPQYFNSDVRISNVARSGRSSKSFIDEGLWNLIYNRIEPGNYVIIQFGHNDAKSDEARHTDPWTTYSDNLRKFIRETREKGGIPILCTPIRRRAFNADGSIRQTHGEYPDAVRQLAADSSVTLVDLTIRTGELLERFGPDSSKMLFNWVAPGESDLYPNGNEDDTHLNDRGATATAGLFVEGLQEISHPLTNSLATAVTEAEHELPEKFRLAQNYPNPFNPATTIEYELENAGHVRLSIHNIRGQRIAQLVDKKQTAGPHRVVWHAKNQVVVSGTYWAKLSVGESQKMIKMTYVR